jgi:LysR family nitrogen assimilation transcriptional regulator
MRAAAANYPAVELQLNEELTGNLIDQLLRGQVDIAVITPAGRAQSSGS